MAIEVFAGETVRVTAADLTHSDDGAVTSAATVTVTLFDPAGDEVDEQVATNEGDDWYVDLAAPATPGQYTVKVNADVTGATARDKTLLTVKAW